MSNWVAVRIAERRRWAPDLETFTLVGEAPLLTTFEPGQFVNLGLDRDGHRIKRAYSLASAPGAPPEFYVARVAEGAFTPGLFELGASDALWLDPAPQGFFTLRWLPEAARELRLVATGTGLGPFVSMWRSPGALDRFERVIIVHGARERSHFGYEQELDVLVERDPRFVYQRLVSREAPGAGVLGGRIPAAFSDGTLEAAVGCRLDPERSHLMLCGNPDMLAEVSTVLEGRGLRKHRQRQPGHLTMEKYW